LNPLERLSVVSAVPEGVGTAIPETDPEERASETIFQVPLPVASAIMLPPFRNPSMLSIRSGTVMKAKEPARAIIRGNAITRSLGKGLVRAVVFEVAAIVRVSNRSEGNQILGGRNAELRPPRAIAGQSGTKVMTEYSISDPRACVDIDGALEYQLERYNEDVDSPALAMTRCSNVYVSCLRREGEPSQ